MADALYLYQIVCAIFFLLLCLSGTPIKAAKCSSNEYGVKSSDGKISCRPCSDLPKCPNGMGVSIACGNIVPHGTHVHCVHCVLGRNFSAHYDRKPCMRCQSMLCHKNEKVLGTCLLDSDTSTCSGTCKKGFYPSGNSLDDCQPCSACHNGSKHIEKCKEDGLPVDKQCKLVALPLFTSKNVPRSLEKNEDQEVCKVYGHPALLAFFLVVIVVLLLLLAWSHRQKCQRISQANAGSPEGTQLSDVHVDSGVDETDSYDGTVDLNAIRSVRKRKSSTSSGGRKVPFSRQNSNTGSDFSDEKSLQSGTPAGEMFVQGETDAVEKNTLPTPGQRHTSSGTLGSPAQRVGIFKRQNSNPVPEHKEEKPFHKRSMTFSSFTSISGPKGTAEETAPIFESTDCDEDEVLLTVALPPEKSSSAASHRLAGVKIGKINAEVYRQICEKLNTDLLNNDWRTLAGRMGYESELVKRLEKETDPADKLLEYWDTQEGNDAAKLLELVRGMSRSDVVGLLEKV